MIDGDLVRVRTILMEVSCGHSRSGSVGVSNSGSNMGGNGSRRPLSWSLYVIVVVAAVVVIVAPVSAGGGGAYM